VADITINSLTGLVTLCRQNVLRDIENQNPKLADRLATKEPQYTKHDKFARKEDHLEKEVISARALLDAVTGELQRGSLEVTPELVEHLGLLEKAAVTDRYDEAIDRLVSPVDQDARSGKKEHKSWAGYKGHVIVEEDSEIITAVETTPANKADGSQLKPLLKQQEEVLNLVPQELSGDKAYGSGANLEILDSKHVTGYVSLVEKFNRLGRDLFSQDDFKYDTENETLTCPAGYVASHPKGEIVYAEGQRRKGIQFQFTHRQCSGCELKAKCCPGNSKIHGRAIHINYYHSYYNQMKERMESEEGKEAYRNRYKIEHKIADLARYCGMRRCRYRGLSRARIHTLLAATVSNIKRMARLLWKVTDGPPLEYGMAA
jgi:IS5 family transposase